MRSPLSPRSEGEIQIKQLATARAKSLDSILRLDIVGAESRLGEETMLLEATLLMAFSTGIGQTGAPFPPAGGQTVKPAGDPSYAVIDAAVALLPGGVTEGYHVYAGDANGAWGETSLEEGVIVLDLDKIASLLPPGWALQSLIDVAYATLVHENEHADGYGDGEVDPDGTWHRELQPDGVTYTNPAFCEHMTKNWRDGINALCGLASAAQSECPVFEIANPYCATWVNDCAAWRKKKEAYEKYGALYTQWCNGATLPALACSSCE